jgi:FkbM family methyltransferase
VGADVVNAIALPNGMKIDDASPRAAATVYDEIFVQRRYLANGITIADGDVIVDAGANVGLFSLWARSNWQVQVHAFEPVFETCYAARRNLIDFIGSVQISNNALGDTIAIVEFLTCPRVTQWSSRRSMPVEQHDENLRHVLRGMDASGWGWLTRRLPERLRAFIARRVLSWHEQRQAETCMQITWSHYADCMKIDKVDLFKIDVEGAEVEVLKGIADRHWPGIRQFVIEAHSFRLAVACERILKARGFKIVTDCGPGLPMIYARRT